MSETDAAQANILVVDDNYADLGFLTEMLTWQGYAVQTASNGHSAIVSAQTELPDLILLDVMMPRLNGYEVCEKLKADERTRDIPVIFVSALSEALNKVKAFSLGAVDYIVKPFDVEEIVARVKIHLALRTLQQDLGEKNVQLEREIAERQQVAEALRHYTYRLETMHKLDQSILAARSPETIAVAAIGRIRHLMPCQRAIVIEVTEEGQLKELTTESSGEIALRADGDIYGEMFEGQSLSALKKGLVRGVEDLAGRSQRSAMQQALYEEGVCSYVVVPLRVHGELIGTLHVEADHPRAFTADHINTAIEIAALGHSHPAGTVV